MIGCEIGQFNGAISYIERAKQLNVNALNVPGLIYGNFKRFGQLGKDAFLATFNRAFLDAARVRGDRIILNNSIQGATGSFFKELEYLWSRGFVPKGSGGAGDELVQAANKVI